ncbi:hypothetical protein niasHS_013223 [Heterodera schachtii]|uniref:Phorbol-ester/DAG-type domain-containing protein n=1 Tax=Heterodera schachtii TaxID=97005 RepID=A0ABD2IA59_HETSC
MDSPLSVTQKLSIRSEFEHFVDSQIAALIAEAKAQNVELSRENELEIAIDFCKKYLLDDNRSEAQIEAQKNEETQDGEGKREKQAKGETDGERDGERERHRAEVLAKLVELKLELEQYKETLELNSPFEAVSTVNGHQFMLQSSKGRNPYCETCLGTIWRLAQHWRRCKMRRVCPSLALARTEFSLQFELCPEKSLLAQNYQCAECFSPIGFDDDSEKLPRICDFTGLFYCRRCHWNDEMIVPARIVRNWDFGKRAVCRATKQMLTTAMKRPLINFEKENPTLFKFVHKLDKIQKMRTNIMLMKCYFVSCKFARKMRILQHLSRFQHFVENDTMFTMDDLLQLANGRLLADIEAIVRIFTAHITEECEICRGNAFFCELCTDNQRIYPFSENVAICKSCCAVYHRPCFDRASKRCPRCLRRKARRKSVMEENEEEEEDGQ